MPDFDSLLLTVGEFGRYQKTRFFLLCVPAAFLCSWAFAVPIFILKTPDHHCAIPPLPKDGWTNSSELRWVQHRLNELMIPKESDNGEISLSKCRMLIPDGFNFSSIDNVYSLVSNSQNFFLNESKCLYGWTYDTSDWSQNVVTKWDLVCDNDWIVNTLFMMMTIGSILGLLLFSFLQDRFGRRPTFFVSLGFFILPGLLYMFAPVWQVLALLMFLKSFAGTACFEIPWLMAIELVGPTRHTLVMMCMCIAFALACICLSGMAYVCRTWIQLVIAATTPAILLYSYWFILDESGRWLFATGRIKRGYALLRQISKENGTNINDVVLQQLVAETGVAESKALAANDRMPERQYGFWTLFSRRNLALKTIIISYIYGVNVIIYYGLNINIEHLGGNQYLVYALVSFVDIPASLCVVFSDRAGRLVPMCLMLVFSGIFSLSSALVPFGATWAIILFACLAKFCISFSFDIIYLVAGELFPTVIRASGVGISGFIASILNIPTPFIVYSNTLHRSLPMGIFGLLALIGGAVGLLLPETSGAHLNESIEDGEHQTVGWRSFHNNITCRFARKTKGTL